MPIYPYRCTSCGFETEVMRKISDPLLTICPQCKSDQFSKQLTAPGFQLKGTGWYATDFKNGGAKGAPASASKDAKPSEASGSESPAAATASPSESASDSSTPKAAPTATPATKESSSGTSAAT